jgi:hypothetical protein
MQAAQLRVGTSKQPALTSKAIESKSMEASLKRKWLLPFLVAGWRFTQWATR